MPRIMLMRTTILKEEIQAEVITNQDPHTYHQLCDDGRTLHCYIDIEGAMAAAEAEGVNVGSTQYGDLVRYWQNCNKAWAKSADRPTCYFTHKFYTWRIEH